MLSQVYYLVRSKKDGQYLVARPRRVDSEGPNPSDAGFLLVFPDHADALSYLNTHAGSMAEQFAVESLPGTQLGGLLKRWGFRGLGMVNDPLVPQVEFLRYNPNEL